MPFAVTLAVVGLADAAPGESRPSPEPTTDTVPVCEAARAKGFRSADGGWIFMGYELDTRAVPSPESRQGLADLARALAGGSTRVVVLLLPARPLAISAAVADYDRALAEQRYRELVAFFEGNGLPVVDLLAASREPLGDDSFFLRRDGHLSHAGGKRLATALRDRLASLGMLADLPTASMSVVPTGRVPQQREALAEHVSRLCGTAAPSPEQTSRWKLVREPPASLLGEEAAPQVALWGTSNAGLGGMDRFIEAALQSPVDTLATKGGGVLGSLYTSLREPGWAASPPRVAIWEVSSTEYWRTGDDTPDPRDPAVYDELVPAAWGACSEAQSLAWGDWAESGEPLLQATTTVASYLVMEAETADVQSMMVTTTAGVARRLGEYDRASAQGRYFLRLAGVTGPLSVSASWTSTTGARVRARLCPVPSG